MLANVSLPELIPLVLFKVATVVVNPVKLVAVEALPVVLWLSVGKLVKAEALPFGAK